MRHPRRQTFGIDVNTEIPPSQRILLPRPSDRLRNRKSPGPAKVARTGWKEFERHGRGLSLLEPYQLFVSPWGRIRRATFVLATIFLLTSYLSMRLVLEAAGLDTIAMLVGVVPLWGGTSLCLKRYHDLDHSGLRLLLLGVPLFGPIWVAAELCLRKGRLDVNRFGMALEFTNPDYLQNEDLRTRPPLADGTRVVNDVTQINPIAVKDVVRPQSVEELVACLSASDEPLCIGGGRFSMGGQTASPGCLHVDMRSLNRVLMFSPVEKTIRVQTGIRWCDLQRFLDPHDLSVRIMQTYANFTVGGSLSVNVHGRYMGQGPLILSVRAIRLLTADGRLLDASPSDNPELFYGAIGGYGGLGVIVEAELSLADNVRVQRRSKTMAASAYWTHFQKDVRQNGDAIFHNADLYPPHYHRLRSVTYWRTDDEVTVPHRLHPVRAVYPVQQYFFWAFSQSPLGKWRRERIYEPLMFMSRPVQWRNYEASYDVRELEPQSRKKSTYVLQEYFVPVARFDEFVPLMREIFQRHRANVINVSVRHAQPDIGALLAWAREEVFAFVIYYKQGVDDLARGQVAVWTRELIDAAVSLDGTYYLPYQIHATPAQFHRAYPRAGEYFALKKKWDPHYRFRNALWDAYYRPALTEEGGEDARDPA